MRRERGDCDDHSDRACRRHDADTGRTRMIAVEQLLDTDDDLTPIREEAGCRNEMLRECAATRDVGEALRVLDAIGMAGGDEIVTRDLAVDVERTARRMHDRIEEQG